MKTKISNLLTSLADYTTKIYNEYAVRAEQRRKYEEELHKQKLANDERMLYVEPYTLQLRGEQLTQLDMSYNNWNDTSSVTLYPHQSQEITLHRIRQAVINNDVATLKNLATEITLSFDDYMDRVRWLHFLFYQIFFNSYCNSGLTYAQMTSPNGYFLCYGNQYALIYSCRIEKNTVLQSVKDNFHSFLGTTECKQLLTQFRINKATITYDVANSNLVILIR